MGISVELWRARIGLFSGGRGSRPHSKAPSTKQQPLHFSDTVGTTAKVVQGGLLLLYILKFLSSQDKTEFLKRTRNVGLLVVSIAVLLHSLAHLLLLAGDVESNPGPQMDETLTLDDLNEAHTKLHDSRNRWFEIGQALHVDDITLDSIRKQCANDDICLREVLAHRLKSGPPLTWKELLNSQCALGEHSRTIGQLERSLSTSLHGSSAQPVSTVLQGLLDKYQLCPSQVDSQIKQIDTPCLAAYFDNVELYVDLMELTTGEQTDVEGAKTNHLAVIKCLKIWKRKNPAQATFRTLLEMLIKLRKEEIANQICQYMKDPMRRTLPNDTTTTQSLKLGNWTEDLLNSLPTQSSKSSIPGGCTLSSTKSLHDSLERSDTHQPDHPVELADDGDVSSGDESFHSATDNRDIFVCPYCKECSPQQFFSKEGCPKKTRSLETTSLFPYLDVTGLDDEDVIDLEERLISDTREIMIKFSDFSLCIRESLEARDQSLPLDKLQDCVLSAVVLQKDERVSALDSEHKKMVLAANSLAKIFSILRVYDYISFLNYQIIELLIQHYGNADDHKLLEQYLADLKTFCERNVFEVPSSAFSSHRSRKTAKVFALKCTEPTLTLQGVRAMQNNVAEILGLEFNALQLCSVRKGCVELHFLVSAAVAELIFPLSPSQQLALSEIGARLLPFDEEKEKEMVKDASVDILTPKVLAMSLSEQQAPTTDCGEPRRSPTVNDGELRQPPTFEELYSHPDMSLKENAEVLQLKSLAIQKNENTLRAACQRGDIETVKLLVAIDKGENLKIWGERGIPLHVACENGHTETAQLLIDRGADVNNMLYRMRTPLHVACENGHTDTAQMLIDRGADMNRENSAMKTPLHDACKEGHTETAQLLIDKGSNVNQQSWCKDTPLHGACENGHTETAQLLIDRGADMNRRNCIDRTPFHVACEYGHTGTALMLIDRGADVNQQHGEIKKTPLYVACENGHTGTAQLLIDRGADVNKRTTSDTPLHGACRYGHTDTAQFLIDRGADVNQQHGKTRNTPLHIACKNGHTDTAQLLIDRGADVNQQHWRMRDTTPLHAACEKGHTETAQMLIDRGANVNKENRVKMASLNAQPAREKGHNKTRSQNWSFSEVDTCLDAETDIDFSCDSPVLPFSSSPDLLDLICGSPDPHPMKTTLNPEYIETMSSMQEHIQVKMTSQNAQSAREKGHNKTTPSQDRSFSGVEAKIPETDFSKNVDPVKFSSHRDPHPMKTTVHLKDTEVPKSIS